MNTTQGDPIQAAVIDAQAFQRERALQHLQNVFEGKVDAGVIRHVLSESQWKGTTLCLCLKQPKCKECMFRSSNLSCPFSVVVQVQL